MQGLYQGKHTETDVVFEAFLDKKKKHLQHDFCERYMRGQPLPNAHATTTVVSQANGSGGTASTETALAVPVSSEHASIQSSSIWFGLKQGNRASRFHNELQTLYLNNPSSVRRPCISTTQV